MERALEEQSWCFLLFELISVASIGAWNDGAMVSSSPTTAGSMPPWVSECMCGVVLCCRANPVDDAKKRSNSIVMRPSESGPFLLASFQLDIFE